MIKSVTSVALTAMILLPVSAAAHELNTASGSLHPHQHVYQRDSYGKPLRQGHFAQPAGSTGIVIWGSSRNTSYGQAPVLNNAEISQPGQVPVKQVKRKSGLTSTLRRQTYGKPIR